MASTQGQTLESKASNALPSLANFSHLPYGLQASIITMACWLPSTRSTCEVNEHPVVLLDVEMTKSLALVSKAFYDVAVKTLYASLRITRPTTLRLLVAAFLDRPALGRLVKSLHIGPADALPKDWLPIYDRKLVLSMSAPSDHGRYPDWITPPHPVYFSGLDTEGRPMGVSAIQGAIVSASYALNVNVNQVSESQSGLRMPSCVWYRRLFEVFAAVELYVMELPLYEDERKTSLKDLMSVRYPRLVLTGTPPGPAWPGAPAPKKPAPAFTLSCNTLRTRLAAPYSSTDRFDHPLLFARSNVAWEAEGPEGDLRSGGDQIRWSVEDADQPASSAEALRDPAALSHATLGTMLGLARTLLGRTPLLRNLSLTGFLERAICGIRTVGELKELRTCTLGPPPSCWHWVPALRLDSKALANVQKLRICGHVLASEQAKTIAGGTLASLREFQWSYPKQITDEGATSLPKIVNILTGRAPKSEQSASSHSSLNDPDNRKRLLIEARLHAHDVTRILDSAQDAATRSAWEQGAAPPDADESSDSHRLKLVNTRASEDVSSTAHSFCMKQMEVLYEEGREWFEDRVKG